MNNEILNRMKEICNRNSFTQQIRFDELLELYVVQIVINMEDDQWPEFDERAQQTQTIF